jgi:predicted short-subunit dehydrogenase-like oxidoreductase (DUF2520 family)
MIRICIIGTGNLGFHLCHAFSTVHNVDEISAFAKAESPPSSQKLQLVGYLNKSGASLPKIADLQFFNYQDIPDCDLIIIAVPDDLITDVALQIPKSDAVVVHTSGTVSIAALKSHEHRGVFYLPQSFSSSKKPDFSNIPVCLEASDPEVMILLENVAKELSPKIVRMDSAQRKQLHLAAVYMNNFVNHCYAKSHEILNRAAIPTDALDHLMRETMLKAIDLTPAKAQTGPAQRNDAKTIAAHLALLPQSERALYQNMTQSIQNKKTDEL